MASRTSPTFRRKKLARRLRALRDAAGLKQEAAAADLYLSKSRLGRIELAEVGIDVHLVRSMLDLYQVYDSDERADLLDLAVEAQKKGWWQAYGLNKQGYIGLETEACEIRDYTLSLSR